MFADDPRMFADDPRRFANDLRRFANDLRRFADDPRRFADDPLRFADDPRMFADDPRMFADDPRMFADDLRMFADDLRRFADELRRFADDLRRFADDLRKVAEKFVFGALSNKKRRLFTKQLKGLGAAKSQFHIPNREFGREVRILICPGVSPGDFPGTLRRVVALLRLPATSWSHGRAPDTQMRIKILNLIVPDFRQFQTEIF